MHFFSRDNPQPADPFSEPGIKASIDIGTNTILLLVADVHDGKIDVLHELQRLPRLGRDVDQHKILSMSSMERAIEVLIEYRDLIFERWGMIPVMVTATSAVRDASNRMEFMWLVEEATGYRVRLLSGEEEARCTYRGALSQIEGAFNNVLITDIGGGSTELAFGHQTQEIRHKVSLDFGSVRFTERFLGEGPVSADQIQACRTHIVQELTSVSWLNEGGLGTDFQLIGVAGTATTIGAVLRGHTKYEAAQINQMAFTREELSGLIDQLSGLKPTEIESINPVFLKGRADIILAGCIILYEIMNTVKADKIRVSTGGIRHGTLLEKLYG